MLYEYKKNEVEVVINKSISYENKLNHINRNKIIKNNFIIYIDLDFLLNIFFLCIT